MTRDNEMSETELLDVVIIGAGPTGLACAIELERLDYSYAVIEKGCVVNSLFHFPTQMIYFTTPELLEIGDLPLVCEREKPSRLEALKYYRRVVETYRLRVHQYEKALTVSGADGDFTIQTELASNGENRRYRARKIIIATGYYDHPNYLGIPGEDLPKVAHYYSEAHPFYDRDVAIIGAGNSAADAALELFRSGARVTLIHRKPDLSRSLKYWVAPDITNRINNGEIKALFNTVVTEIRATSICVRTVSTDEEQELPNDFVFALTGYHADYDFLRSLGVRLDPATLKPELDPETLECNVKGMYMAGVVIAGVENNKVFIENGRFHGKQIIAALREALPPRAQLSEVGAN
ncbi:MAG: YpdA family putative bacillithiol disulfide reductase [Blastocatellales bacterium]|nr:YpdA family putative bacillithiol disulfide reductase [Blastocatellales bacterium]